MIGYIKEYGVTNLDYDFIMHNVKSDIIELLALSESQVRDNLEYYNELGIKKNISKLILYRPDLILISKENLIELLSKIDKKVFITTLEKKVEDLILFGI